jgi:hypothetical protein
VERKAFLLLVYKRWWEAELHVGKEQLAEARVGSEVEEERCSPSKKRKESFAGDDAASGWEHP